MWRSGVHVPHVSSVRGTRTWHAAASGTSGGHVSCTAGVIKICRLSLLRRARAPRLFCAWHTHLARSGLRHVRRARLLHRSGLIRDVALRRARAPRVRGTRTWHAAASSTSGEHVSCTAGDAVYLCWPIAPSRIRGGGGGVAGSHPMGTAVHITWHGAQINFGYLKYLHIYLCLHRILAFNPRTWIQQTEGKLEFKNSNLNIFSHFGFHLTIIL